MKAPEEPWSAKPGGALILWSCAYGRDSSLISSAHTNLRYKPFKFIKNKFNNGKAYLVAF